MRGRRPFYSSTRILSSRGQFERSGNLHEKSKEEDISSRYSINRTERSGGLRARADGCARKHPHLIRKARVCRHIHRGDVLYVDIHDRTGHSDPRRNIASARNTANGHRRSAWVSRRRHPHFSLHSRPTFGTYRGAVRAPKRLSPVPRPLQTPHVLLVYVPFGRHRASLAASR